MKTPYVNNHMIYLFLDVSPSETFFGFFSTIGEEVEEGKRRVLFYPLFLLYTSDYPSEVREPQTGTTEVDVRDTVILSRKSKRLLPFHYAHLK